MLAMCKQDPLLWEAELPERKETALESSNAAETKVRVFPLIYAGVTQF